MEKRSTILLTVIAVATLLVAVAGATFAFFAVGGTNNANVGVTATTSAGTDVFNATGSGSLSLTVNNEVMMQGDADDTNAAVEDTDNNMVVSLRAGSGVATCTYKLTYTSTGDAYTKTSGVTKEYTLAGTAGTGLSFDETNMDAVTSFGPYTITNNATTDTAATEQTWTFTTKFYNTTIDQSTSQIGKTYVGNLKVTDVNCTNTAVVDNSGDDTND